jgi:hypothetical protein
VRPIALALTLLVLTAGCETSTDPFLFGIGGSGGGVIAQADAAGDWSFTVTKTSSLPCSGALADGSVITAHLDVLADGTLNTSTSFWQNPPTTVIFPLSGAVTLTSGSTDLILSSGSGTGSGMELRGTITTTRSFSGTLIDPAAGLSPMFSTATGCEYNAPGTKA